MAQSPSTSLYRQLLGSRFDALPSKVRALHDHEGRRRYRGKVEVDRGAGMLSRICGWATRLPQSGHGPIRVEIAAHAGRERWSRAFAGHVMRSRLWARNGLLCERLGLVTFGFHLDVADGAILWRVECVRALGVPLPAAWFARVQAREFERDGRYRFEVTASLPWVGLLVHYRGWLHDD